MKKPWAVVLAGTSVLTLSLVLYFGARARATDAPPRIPPQDPLWSEFIGGHTSGLVSRKSDVRVQFVDDVVSESDVGTSADSVLEVDPEIEGTVTFASTREIVLVPTEDLPMGRYYRGSVRARALRGFPSSLDTYDFVFQVIQQELEVDVSGLSASETKEGTMDLQGSIATADVADADSVESILTATYLGSEVSLTWRHSGDGKRHDFEAAGLERQTSAEPVRLVWNGSSIGVDLEGTREVEVPARDRFQVTQVLTSQEPQAAILVYFSDLLDSAQNLIGLVHLDQGGHTAGAKIAADDQWRFPPTENVPEKFAKALVAYEDKRFYDHPGVDPLAIARALYLNLSRGRTVSGGSTLTMQVIRLARGDPARSYPEKLLEAILALRLELGATKSEILALHASHAPFGGNVVGLEAASWRYFGRPPGELSWAESATLAVLPNAPKLVHPGRNRERLREKRDGLLRKLRAQGILSEIDLELALLEPLPSTPLPIPANAPHLLSTLIAESSSKVHRFETTVSTELQRVSEEVVERHAEKLRSQGIHNAAVLVIDNRSFEVLAYVGNTEPPEGEDRGEDVDIVRRPRSTGSILKPFLFAAMVQEGEILPTTLVPDVPVQYAGFMPENFDRTYRGAVPARVALAQSLNVPAVHMLKRHGVERFQALLQNFGMTTLFRPPDDYGLTLVLGGAEGTLWDVTSMYGNLADIARRETSRGPYRTLKVLRGEETSSPRMAEIGPGAAWLTLEALTEVVRPGEEGYWRNFTSSHPIAWKTGTSFGLRDAWAVGTTSRHTVGVWVGNASGEGRPNLTGASAAAPILFDLFSRLGESDWFTPPYRFMKRAETCGNDGFLAAGSCDTEAQWVPSESHFEEASPHNRLVHLDETGRFRVDGNCESPGRMDHRSWFVLPPGQEFYFRRSHADYRPLPPFRRDCAALADAAPIDFLYPHADTSLYIPLDLGAKKGRTVFEAVHREPSAILFWHLDDRYLGATKTFHQQALDVAPGVHVLTVVDETGNRLSRRFEVLGESR